MPTIRFPKCAYYDTFIEFWPKDLQRVIFTYLREPKIPEWKFTNDPNGRPVYDAAKSIDL